MNYFNNVSPAELQTTLNVVGYCRYSSEHQTVLSIEAQKRAITEYCEKNNYKITDWYVDEAISGGTIERPAFQRLLSQVSSKVCPFQGIVVHKLDRLSRNVVDSYKLRELFADYNIRLMSVCEDYINNDILFGITSVLNNHYINNLRNEVMKGMKEKAYKAEFNGGCPPLGYKVVDGKYVIDDAEAIIIKTIYEMAAKGYGYNQIIRAMISKGYKTKNGNDFSKTALYQILTNERYKGIYVFNKVEKRNRNKQRNSHKYKDPSEIIRVEDGCPAIVSKELWEKANLARKVAAGKQSNAKHPYLLSGLLYCGECGCKMHGNHRKYGDSGYNTYRCNKKGNKLNCNSKEIKADSVDQFVLDSFCNFFFSDSVAEMITKQINQTMKDLLKSNSSEETMARKALQGLKIVQKNLVEAISNAGYSKTLTDKLEATEKQIHENESIIEAEQAKKENRTVDVSEVKEQIYKLKTYFANPKHIDETKYILHQYIHKVIISRESVKVIFKIAFPMELNGNNIELTYNQALSEPRSTVESVLPERKSS